MKTLQYIVYFQSHFEVENKGWMTDLFPLADCKLIKGKC